MNDLYNMILVVVASGFMGTMIGVFYKFTHSRAVYASRMIHALVIYAILTSMMLYLRISVSAASVIGAAAIVRFRSPVKDHRDLVYILWAVIAGFCSATHKFEIIGVASVFIVLILVAFKANKRNDRVLLAVKGDGKKEDEIIAMVSEIADSTKIRMLENNSIPEVGTELIYEMRDDENSFNLAQKIKNMLYSSDPDVSEVMVSYQEDEMSI